MIFSFFQTSIGTVATPRVLKRFGDVEDGGIASLLSVAIDALIIGAGLFALFNFVLAGYAFMSAGNDAKKIEGAWAKIWQTVLGLVISAGAFVIAAIVSQIFFGGWDVLLNPTIPTPSTL